jgi:leucyl-tRNA synthetase
MMPVDCDADTAKNIALSDDAVKSALNGKEPRKVIYVQGRLVNIVI